MGMGIAILALAIALGGMMTAVFACSRRGFETRASDCIIVLGAQVWMDGTLSRTLEARVDAALEAYRAGIANKIIVCGGQGSNEPTSEAEAMRAFLVGRGVPEADVYLEDQSVNTKQNLENARAIMRAQGWKTAAIATSDYHLTRAMWLARDLGIDACGISAQQPVRLAVKISNYARESASWALYALRKVF